MTGTDAWLAAADARIALREEEGKPFTGLLTANADADAAVRELVVSSGSEQWDSAIEAIYEANDNTFSLPANAADAEFKTAWSEAVNRTLTGADAAESLARAQTEAQAALDKAWNRFDEED
jgi:multiple sugar transport system substrate-binding protein